jgi:aryl-alcohol dehydrogenase-like predicted oxidoreductase
MKTRRIGESGLEVSEIALGSWLNFGSSSDVSDTTKVIEHAFDLGVNFFDTADVYSSGHAEEVLGRALRPIPRHQLVIATKCFFPMSYRPNDRGLSREHLFESVDASLNRLETDYLDLHQCHRFDPETPLAETVRAYDDLIQMGKVLYWGVSEWTAQQIALACKIADQMSACRPISNQPGYSILRRGIERTVLPECKRQGMGQVVFSPLAQGVLTGKYCRGAMPEGSRATHATRGRFMGNLLAADELERVESLIPLAEAIGISLPQLALAWCLRDTGISSVIVGASQPYQLDDNCSASGIVLPPEAIQQIERTFTVAPDEPNGS